MGITTAKHRINLSVDDRMFKHLSRLSKKMDKKITSMTLDLVAQALELQEDIYFSRESDSRVGEPTIPHDKAWK